MSIAYRPKILILGDFSYSRAQGAHVSLGLAKPLSEAGFAPEFLSGHMDETGIRSEFQEFPCHYAPQTSRLSGWRAAIKNLSASEHPLLHWLEQIPIGHFFAVIADPGCGATVAFLSRLRNLCKAKAWKLVTVVVEWQKFWRYGSSKFHHSLMTAADSEIQIRVVNKRINNVIAVSTYLERYYEKAGCKVLRVPPLIDSRAAKWHCQPLVEAPNRDLTLLFSGTWLRERFDLIIQAINYLRSDGQKITLELLGCRPNDMGRNPQLRQLIAQSPPGTLRFHGWVPAERVLPITAAVDFAVLLRDKRRWSNACFPSKVAEFQALGVPLICNLTSDLDQVLKDGENALIVPDVTAAALVATIKRATALTPFAKEKMKESSRQRAATYFEYRNHVGRLGNFIRSL